MNWLEFLSSLAWPVVILIAALKLKGPLSNLISTLAKIKYKEWEFEFTVEKKLDEIQTVVTSNQKHYSSKRYSGSSPNVIRGDNNSILKDDITPLSGYSSKDIHSSVDEIVFTKGLAILDETVIKLYMTVYEKNNPSEKHDWPGYIERKEIPIMLDYLRNHDVINPDVYKIIKDIRELPQYFAARPVQKFIKEKYMNTCENLIHLLTGKLEDYKEQEPSYN